MNQFITILASYSEHVFCLGQHYHLYVCGVEIFDKCPGYPSLPLTTVPSTLIGEAS